MWKIGGPNRLILQNAPTINRCKSYVTMVYRSTYDMISPQITCRPQILMQSTLLIPIQHLLSNAVMYNLTTVLKHIVIGRNRRASAGLMQATKQWQIILTCMGARV
eukprot:5119540-Amphidinium_carterae.1